MPVCPFMSDSQSSVECAKENCAIYNENETKCAFLMLSKYLKAVENELETIRGIKENEKD